MIIIELSNKGQGTQYGFSCLIAMRKFSLGVTTSLIIISYISSHLILIKKLTTFNMQKEETSSVHGEDLCMIIVGNPPSELNIISYELNGELRLS